MKKNVLASALALIFSSSLAMAADTRDIKSPTGQTIFKIRFFDEGQGPFNDDEDGGGRSSHTLNEKQKAAIERAVSLWAERLKPAPGARPAVINVGTIDEDNAYGDSPERATGENRTKTALQLVFAGQRDIEQEAGADGHFVIGTLDFDAGEGLPSQLPVSGKVDLVATAFHELAHGLSIGANVGYAFDDEDESSPRFFEELGSWSRHLIDDNGNAVKPGAPILCQGCDYEPDPDGFDVRQDQAHFAGKHVTEVLAGAMPGIPVKTLHENLDGSFVVNPAPLTHSELKNSMMSHQNFRNYTTFMEAELAALQDMGYDIDRRNFYGFSVYGNDQQLINKNGYFARNAEGTAYLPGQYNQASLGVGLHIYGDRNTLSQQADLLTRGAGAAGVRVDGVANTLTIAKGTKVHADGSNGRGVMFAYGKDHRLAIAGDVQAMGEHGIGASFDFGNNMMGNNTNYRGSHINTAEGEALDVPEEIDGSLVKTFDLTGRVAGKQHAIFISRNALVDQINIMQGAQIDGSIQSDYAEQDRDGKLRLTRVTFGETADASGQSTGQADRAFTGQYDGNITGRNIVLEPKAGVTSLNGKHKVHTVTVAADATLAGNGTYAITPGETFVNHGTISPGNSIGRISIDGDYRQSDTGTLRIDTNGAGQTDVLAISGHAQLAGQMIVAPQADWYGEGWTLRTDDALQAGSTDGGFDAITAQLDSPTLKASTVATGTNAALVRIDRPANAYSQYANDGNAVRAGQALRRVAATATSDARSLLQTLDFSSTDGGTIGRALDQINPSGYSAVTAGSLAREQQIAGLLTQRATRSGAAGQGVGTSEWVSFATTFGGGQWQDRRGDTVGYNSKAYGLLAGAEKRSETLPDWVFGGFSAVSGQSVGIRAPYDASGKTTAFNVGLHARYAPNDTSGPFAYGQARIGTEDGRLDRRIAIADYSAKNTARWTGWNSGVTLGGGYRWALTESVNVGPLAALSYTHLARPGITETGASATRLRLGSAGFDSLRASLGVVWGVDIALNDKQHIRADLQVTWDRELLDRAAKTNARFADYSLARMSSRNAIGGRDSVGLRTGLTYQVQKNVTVGASVSSQFFMSGQRSVNGDVALNWRF